MTGQRLPCEPRPRLTFMESAIVGIILTIIVTIVVGYIDHVARHKAFIAECMADGRKSYECEALWGQAQAGGHSVPLLPPK